MTEHTTAIRMGIAVCDKGPFPTRMNGKPTRPYSTWGNVMERCYSSRYKAIKPSYADVVADPRFHHFQEFAEWAVRQAGHDIFGWHLDKDIMVKGNRIYGPDTCVYVPWEINTIFSKVYKKKANNLPRGVFLDESGRYGTSLSIRGRPVHAGMHDTPEQAFMAYRAVKEARLKELANEFKPLISERLYERLIGYEFDIND